MVWVVCLCLPSSKLRTGKWCGSNSRFHYKIEKKPGLLTLVLRGDWKDKPTLVRFETFSMLSASQRTSLECDPLNLLRKISGNSAGKNKHLSVRSVSILRTALGKQWFFGVAESGNSKKIPFATDLCPLVSLCLGK